MDREAEIVTLYEAAPAPRPRQKKRQRVEWPPVLAGAFIWCCRAGICLLAGMQIRELLGH
jgi:hypothetical protein